MNLNLKVLRYFGYLILLTLLSYFLLLKFNQTQESNLKIMEVDPKKALSLSTYAAEEKTESGTKFRWFVSPGDKLEVRNQTWVDATGMVEFVFGMDPCNTARILTLATPSGPIPIKLESSGTEVRNKVSIAINLKPEEIARFFLVDSSSEICKVSNGDTRVFIAKLISWDFIPN